MSLRWGGRRVSLFSFTLGALPQEVLDGVVDGVLVGDLRERHVLDAVERLAQVLDELAAPVRALDLPVRELVHLGEDLALEQPDAGARVVGAPVVSVGEVEGVDVPGSRVVIASMMSRQSLYAELIMVPPD